LYTPWLMIDGDDWEAINGMNEWQGKPKFSEMTWFCAALSTTDPTSLGLYSNLGHRVGKPATDRLSYGTAWEEVTAPLYLKYRVSTDLNARWDKPRRVAADTFVGLVLYLIGKL
jgi:hypothetical protein